MIEKQPFDRGILIPTDELPCHVIQTINDLCTKLLIMATVTNPGPTQRGEAKPIMYDFNLSLGAMQKALGLLIQNFFKEENRQEVVEQCCEALKRSVKEGYKNYDS